MSCLFMSEASGDALEYAKKDSEYTQKLLDHVDLCEFESDLNKGKIEYLQMLDGSSDSVIVKVRDIKTGRFISSEVDYCSYADDQDVVIKEILNIYRLLKEGASL